MAAIRGKAYSWLLPLFRAYCLSVNRRMPISSERGHCCDILQIHWKSHSHPDAGANPQDILNRQIVDESDFIIAVFWTKLGTPTDHYDSGTVEEIEKFIQAGKPVLLYFSNQPVVPGSVDTEQFDRLKEYQEKIKNKALYAEFSTVWNFRELLSTDREEF